MGVESAENGLFLANVTMPARGNGLSDWEVDDLSFAAFVKDLETVVDAVGFDRFALLGISQGCGVSIAYTARHPERVTRLVLYGGFAQGAAKRARSAAEREQLAAVLTLVRTRLGVRRTQRSDRSLRQLRARRHQRANRLVE